MRTAAVGGTANGARHSADIGDNWVSRYSPMCLDNHPEQLMARYQQGDLAAASALIQHLSPQLHRFFLADFGSRGDADDLLQETWMRIHEARHTYRPGEPLLPWLYAIARHIRVDHYRRAQRRTAREAQLDDASSPAPAFPGPSAAAPDLEALLAPLPESQREVIRMLKIAGMSLDEVARATSSSVGSVKQKAHRAYERLRERLIVMGFGKGSPGGVS